MVDVNSIVMVLVSYSILFMENCIGKAPVYYTLIHTLVYYNIYYAVPVFSWILVALPA